MAIASQPMEFDQIIDYSQGWIQGGYGGLWGLKPSLIPSPSFLALECAGSKKVGPGIHCLCMRYKNLMNLIIKSSHNANLRHTHKHSTVPCL